MHSNAHTHTHSIINLHTHARPAHASNPSPPHSLTTNAEEAKLLQILEGEKHLEAVCVDDECAEVVVLSLLEATREDGLQTQQSDHCSQGPIARNAVLDVVHLCMRWRWW